MRSQFLLPPILCAFLVPTATAVETRLCREGQALLPIHVSSDSGEPTEALADTLASYLHQISGANFSVTREPVETAIFLKIAPGPPPDSMNREAYTIRSGPRGLEITGATERALNHAIWDLLHRFGYRQYFPGDTWEIIPKSPTLAIDIDLAEAPAYVARRIWPGFGYWDHNREAWADWDRKNRMGNGFALNTGHAYGRLIRSQQATFDAHPEFYALVQDERRIVPHAKLCVGNPGVIDAAIAYAFDFFEKNPEADSVSVDPSDGGNWCECPQCEAIGPPNDRALTLANAVAKAITAKVSSEKFVGMYAYGYHSLPPSLDVHPNVIVSAATGFIKGGLKIEDIIAGWSDQGATIGIREYYSVHTWDRDLPGAARGSNLTYLAETLTNFHAMGARFLTAESSDNWGCNGLGYYFASRVLWDLEEASKRDQIVDEFLENCFGPARKPMGQFYRLLEGSNQSARLVFDDVLARMFRLLAEARELANAEEGARARIDALILYTRYCELFDRYRNATGEARQRGYEELIRYAYRIRRSHMIHTYALWRDLAKRDRTVGYPEEAHWKVPEGENPWKSAEPFTAPEIEAFLQQGMSNHLPVELDFAPRSFPDEPLVAASSIMDLPEVAPGKAERARGHRSFFTVIEKAPSEIKLHITGGLIKHYRDRGNVKVALWKLGGASQTGEHQTLMDEDESVPPDGATRTISLQANEPGTYRIDLTDGHDLTSVTWPEGQRMSWKMSLHDHPRSMSGRWHLYFYVPEGTERIGLYSAAAGGTLQRPDGSEALDLRSGQGAFLSVEVPEGMDDALWKLHFVAGKVCLLNVPPFLARSPGELVLPSNLRRP